MASMTVAASAPELPHGTSGRRRFWTSAAGSALGLAAVAGTLAATSGGYTTTGIANTSAWAGAYWPVLVVPAGAAIALFVAVLFFRMLRKQAADQLAVRVAVLLASAFSAQGMYEVATTKLHLVWWLASGLFVVAESAMLASAVRAHRNWTKTGSLGKNGRFVWIIASIAGVVVSLNAHSPSEYLLRLTMPLLVAGLWSMGYISEEIRANVEGATTLRWTPRRLAVLLGIVEPGDRDLETVHAERRIRQLTTHAYAFHHSAHLKNWHGNRLRKLALLADDDMVAEVQRRVSRVHFVEASTAPVPPELPPTFRPEPEEAEAELPAGSRTGSSGHFRPEARRRTSGTHDRKARIRRTPEETREAYGAMVAEFPEATREEIARRLGISSRALRTAVNAR